VEQRHPALELGRPKLKARCAFGRSLSIGLVKRECEMPDSMRVSNDFYTI